MSGQHGTDPGQRGAGLLDRHFEQPDAGPGHSRIPGTSPLASSAVPASTDEPSRGAGLPCPTGSSAITDAATRAGAGATDFRRQCGPGDRPFR
jgi:hypothetical protein